MNSYYSNLIEGHKTNPLEVERHSRRISIKTPRGKRCSSWALLTIETEEILKKILQDIPRRTSGLPTS